MDILDKHFLKLPIKRKVFIFLIGICYTLIALFAYFSKLTNVVETLLIVVIGLLFIEIIKLSYRIEYLEKKKKR